MPLTDAQKDANATIRRLHAAGKLTDEQADERRQALGITPDGPRGVVTATDLEIARQLAQDAGESEIDFYRRHAREGDAAIEGMRAKIDERRDWLQRSADDRAKRAFEASPAGRQLRAAELTDEAAARTEQARRARLLLESEGTFPVADIPGLSDDQALRAAGLESEPDEANDPAANRARAEGSDAA